MFRPAPTPQAPSALIKTTSVALCFSLISFQTTPALAGSRFDDRYQEYQAPQRNQPNVAPRDYIDRQIEFGNALINFRKMGFPGERDYNPLKPQPAYQPPAPPTPTILLAQVPVANKALDFKPNILDLKPPETPIAKSTLARIVEKAKDILGFGKNATKDPQPYQIVAQRMVNVTDTGGQMTYRGPGGQPTSSRPSSPMGTTLTGVFTLANAKLNLDSTNSTFKTSGPISLTRTEFTLSQAVLRLKGATLRQDDHPYRMTEQGDIEDMAPTANAWRDMETKAQSTLSQTHKAITDAGHNYQAVNALLSREQNSPAKPDAFKADLTKLSQTVTGFQEALSHTTQSAQEDDYGKVRDALLGIQDSHNNLEQHTKDIQTLAQSLGELAHLARKAQTTQGPEKTQALTKAREQLKNVNTLGTLPPRQIQQWERGLNKVNSEKQGIWSRAGQGIAKLGQRFLAALTLPFKALWALFTGKPKSTPPQDQDQPAYAKPTEVLTATHTPPAPLDTARLDKDMAEIAPALRDATRTIQTLGRDIHHRTTAATALFQILANATGQETQLVFNVNEEYKALFQESREAQSTYASLAQSKAKGDYAPLTETLPTLQNKLTNIGSALQDIETQSSEIKQFQKSLSLLAAIYRDMAPRIDGEKLASPARLTDQEILHNAALYFPQEKARADDAARAVTDKLKTLAQEGIISPGQGLLLGAQIMVIRDKLLAAIPSPTTTDHAKSALSETFNQTYDAGKSVVDRTADAAFFGWMGKYAESHPKTGIAVGTVGLVGAKAVQTTNTLVGYTGLIMGTATATITTGSVLAAGYAAKKGLESIGVKEEASTAYAGALALYAGAKVGGMEKVKAGEGKITEGILTLARSIWEAGRAFFKGAGPRPTYSVGEVMPNGRLAGEGPGTPSLQQMTVERPIRLSGVRAGHEAAPLIEGISKTFEGRRYEIVRLNEDVTVYRAEGGRFGRWFGLEKPHSAGHAERLYNVIDYGNDVVQVSTYKIPRGAIVYAGKVAGGEGHQVFIPDPSRVGVRHLGTEVLPQNGF
jgi:hypothetical protein